MLNPIKFAVDPYIDNKKIESSKYVYVNSNYTASIDDKLAVNSSSNSFEILLPNTNLIAGSQIEIYDITGSFEINNVSVNSNGIIIMGGYDDILLDINNSRVLLIYIDNIIGWRTLR